MAKPSKENNVISGLNPFKITENIKLGINNSSQQPQHIQTSVGRKIISWRHFLRPYKAMIVTMRWSSSVPMKWSINKVRKVERRIMVAVVVLQGSFSLLLSFSDRLGELIEEVFGVQSEVRMGWKCNYLVWQREKYFGKSLEMKIGKESTVGSKKLIETCLNIWLYLSFEFG